MSAKDLLIIDLHVAYQDLHDTQASYHTASMQGTASGCGFPERIKLLQEKILDLRNRIAALP
jgi:hypothetical protein